MLLNKIDIEESRISIVYISYRIVSLYLHLNTMLFRCNNGKLIEINKIDFINDEEYYKFIASCYGYHFNSKQHNTIDTILTLSKKGMNNKSYQYEDTYRKDITQNHNISHI